MGGKAWNLSHNPDVRPLGCNGRYGSSGTTGHKKRGEETCDRCKASAAHYNRERRRGGIKPRKLKPCGTWSAAQRHRFNNEELDFKCRVAEANYQQELRAKKAEAPRDVMPCGTRKAAARHRRRGEEIDDACRKAENAYINERRVIRNAAKKELTPQT